MNRLKSGASLVVVWFLPACGSVTSTKADAGKDAATEVGHADTGSSADERLDTKQPGDVQDHLAPTVVSTDPPPGTNGVVLNQKISATFSEAMDPATLNPTTFTLMQGTAAVPGVVNTVGARSTFSPSSDLAAGTTFTATITTGAKDVAGNALAANHPWSFTTSACAATRVELGAADSFAVLAGSTVANTGATSVVGDVGVSPGTALTGFPPGTIVGFQHPGDSAAAQGEAAVSSAYDDASARTLCAVPIAGDLGGRTLPPGLYNSISSLDITSDDLTLDAQGDGNGVFIFQMATTLTTASGRKIKLKGSAQSANVFWQVGSSATLGGTSTVEGTILAAQSITLNSGATLNGRALARTAAVVLNASLIVKPTAQ